MTKDASNEIKNVNISSDCFSTESTTDQVENCLQELKIDIPVPSRNETLSSDINTSTVKLEDPTVEEIQFKMRRRVCKKIRSILHEKQGLKLAEAEKYTLCFEQAVFTAFNSSIREYIQAIKSVCSRVKVISYYQGQEASSINS